MCGIAGFLNFNEKGHFRVAQLQQAGQILAHRGPDDEGFLFLNRQKEVIPAWSSSFGLPESQPYARPVDSLQTENMVAGLLHRRLAIIDPLPEGHQPFPDAEKKVWISFNGEIYNYKTLRQQLQAEGVSFFTQSDTEVLLQAWKKWGTACVDFLDGMWAFAVLDLNQNLLFLSTDRAGIKPIYYASSDNGFCFSSEIKAFRAFQVPFVENPTAVSRFLVLGRSDESEETFFKNIFRLKGGQSISIGLDSGEISLSSVPDWKVNNWFDFQPHQRESDWVFQIQDLLIEMIRLRLQSDVPLGVCLSGGIDSSTIAGLLAFADKQLKTGHLRKAFMVRMPSEKMEQDWPYAQLVARFCGFQLHGIQPDEQDFLSNISNLIETLDEPPPGPNAFSQYAVFKAVKENGITVSLDGQGADEIFAGYPAHELVAHQDAWRHGQFFPSSMATQWRSMEKGIRENLGFQAEMALWKWKKPELKMLQPQLWNHFQKEEKKPDSLNHFLKTEFTSTTLPFLLKAADRNSMRWSVESRMPFADFAPLIQLLFAIPGSAKWQAGQSKYLLRKAAQPFVPQAVLARRDKVGFAAPNRQWIKSIPSGLWEDILSSPNEWLDVQQVKYWVKNQDRADVLLIWRVFAYLVWRQKILQA